MPRVRRARAAEEVAGGVVHGKKARKKEFSIFCSVKRGGIRQQQRRVIAFVMEGGEEREGPRSGGCGGNVEI